MFAMQKDYHNQTFESAIVSTRNDKAPGGEPVLCVFKNMNLS
jgi:hypothetical protein